MQYSFDTKGICAVKINFEVEDGIVKNVIYTGGCEGNHIGLSKLLEGMEVEDVIKRLKGITCGKKTSSCPDQLATALEALRKEGKF